MQDLPEPADGAFDFHRTQPHVSADRYYRSRSIALGKSLAGRKKIYLDTRYWLFLRDVEMGRARAPIHIQILKTLSALVSTGRAICPMSDVIFMEAVKQTDPLTLGATAQLIDKLSEGVALGNEELRSNTEIARFLHMGQPNLHDLEELVWTRTTSVLGIHYPRLPELTAEEETAVQKGWIDYAWNLGFNQILQQSKSGIFPIADMEATAARLNHDNLAHSAEVRSYQQTVENELVGMLDSMRGLMVGIINNLEERHRGRTVMLTHVEKAEAERLCFNCMANAFRLRPIEVGRALRTLYISAKCFAAVRWDKRRQLEGNDLVDFQHASAAVGYCDAFFTERDLRTLLTTNHVALDKEFGCFIESREAPILAYLEGLQAS